MKSLLRFVPLCSACVLGISISAPVLAGNTDWQHPMIQEYGKVQAMPNAVLQPDPGRQYKVIVNVTKPMTSPDQVNPGLDRVARLVNLFALAKVPLKNWRSRLFFMGAQPPLRLMIPTIEKNIEPIIRI